MSDSTSSSASVQDPYVQGQTSPDYNDDEVRQQIGPWAKNAAPDLSQFDADTNFLIRAAAGSGKTTALVGRMVALVRQGTPVEDLTAITFTRKAAGEMSARLFTELDNVRHHLDVGSVERERVETALANIQSAFIGTIHSFCSRILRERPLDAGLPPDFTAGLEDREERKLRQKAWQQHLRDAHQSDPDAYRHLVECGVDPQSLAPFFEQLCMFPDLEPYTDGSETPPDLTAAVEAAHAFLDKWLPYIPDPRPETSSAPAIKQFEKADRFRRLQPMNERSVQAAYLDLFSELTKDDSRKSTETEVRGTITLKAWGPNKEAAKTLDNEALPAFVLGTVRPMMRQWEAYVHRVATEFTTPAVASFQAMRRQEGMLTFHDLLMLTRDLLRDRPTVRASIQERYPILLVDEFQDTDPLQAEILAYLSSQDPETKDWQACHPRDGSLFIVGDDKQSIYRFRRADMSVFNDMQERLDNEPNGTAEKLTKNFRSQEPICEWCDDAFEALFSLPAYNDIQAKYESFDAQKPGSPDDAAIRRKPVKYQKRNKGDDIARVDAEDIAQFICASYSDSGDVRYSDFLILTRVKKRIHHYTSALARYGIPYTVTGSEDLGDTEEMKAVVDVLRLALRPDDPVAAVAYLKGILVGCSDADLYAFSSAGGRFDAFHGKVANEVASAMPDEAAGRLVSAIERLQRVREVVRDTRPGVGIEAIVDELELAAGTAHPEEPSEASIRAGALLRIMNYVQHLSTQGLGWAEVTDELDRVLQGEEDIDGMTLETGTEDAVRVMNVHQAKGLEAPVVFLVDPYTSGSSGTTFTHVRRDEGQVVAPLVDGEGFYKNVTHAPLGWHADSEKAFETEEERHDTAEHHRLLYVAATRAERLLVVSTYPEKPGKGYWSDLYDALDRADVPDLKIPPTEPPHASEAPAPDLHAMQSDREERIQRQAAPRYHLDTATGAKDEDGPKYGNALHAGEGYGSAFGTAVHEALELAVQHRHQALTLRDAELRRLVDRNGGEATDDAIERLRSAITGFRESAIWEEVTSADIVRPEYRFAHVRPAAGSDPETVLRGTIDLLYRHEGEWSIIDFKSDKVDDPDALDRVLAPDHGYRAQVQAYVDAWRALHGEPIRRAGLWFTDISTFYSFHTS
mgnify:CR=1 FL=1